MTAPLMPKATAVWLVEKTALTFEQIADFCGMHPLEVQAIADGEVGKGINGYDPVKNRQLPAGEIQRCEADTTARLKKIEPDNPVVRRTKGARYTPLARRHDRPDAIAFLLKQYPHMEDKQIVKLLGTTKDTIDKIRTRQHWNTPNIKPRDPVIMGLCTQMDLNAAINLANEKAAQKGQLDQQNEIIDELKNFGL
ncbi:DUF1013 domain-containing protein [Acetobacteraceae bacterium]|nr:DUF1013 domain-containing protein [Acetobacteraceae bacterium]